MFGYTTFFWPVIVGICLYAALVHLQIGLRPPIDRVHTLFGLLALCVGFGVISNIELTTAQTSAAYQSAAWFSTVAATLVFVLLPWFVTLYAGERQHYFAAALSGFFLVVLIGNFFHPYSMRLSAPPVLQEAILPWGERITRSSTAPTAWMNLVWVGYVLTIAYLSMVCARLFRDGPRFRAWGLLLSAGPFAASLAINILVQLRIVNLPYVAAPGFLAIVLVMSVALTREWRHAADALRELTLTLEKRVARRTDELSQLNRELEAFAYSVSHDLRAPLTTVNGFAELLLREHGGKLDQTGARYAQRIRDASLRMAGLIQDLLGLSRVTQQSIERVATDLRPMADTALRTLREADPQRVIEVKIAATLPATGDPKLLALLVSNLLSNAWKYTAKVATPKIEMGRTEKDGECVYFVKDNGAGFNPDQVERLFRPFVRLHSESEFSGTGIGLATAARIVTKHGGRIWAEGALNAGAAFYFTLPTAESAN